MIFNTHAAYLNAPSTCLAQPQGRFRGEADMNRQARLVGLVENDHTGLQLLDVGRPISPYRHLRTAYSGRGLFGSIPC
jgi:hypothetical protein